MTMDNQSPRGGLRQNQRRANAYEDVVPVVVSADYSAADLVATRADAAWGDPVDVRGRDEVTLLVEFTKVAGQTDLHIAFQDGHSDSKAAVNWYDRHGSGANQDGNALTVSPVPLDLALDISGFADGANRVSVPVRVRASFMRFKPWAEGTVADSRCTLRALRVQRYP